MLNTGTGTFVLNFPANNSYLQGSTTNMVVNYPVQFTGTALGGLTVGTTYYILDVIDNLNFTISGSLQTVTVTDSINHNIFFAMLCQKLNARAHYWHSGIPPFPSHVIRGGC